MTENEENSEERVEERDEERDEGGNRNSLQFGYKALFVLVLIAFIVSKIMAATDDGLDKSSVSESVSTEIVNSIHEYEEDLQDPETKERWGLFEQFMKQE